MEFKLLLILIACFALAYFYFGLRKMCFSCFRWNGLKVINSAHSHTETNYKTKNVSNAIRDSHNRIIRYEEQKIVEPTTVNYNQITFECIKCDRQIQRILTSGKYGTEATIVFVICLGLLLISTGLYKDLSSTYSNSTSHKEVTNDLNSNPNQLQPEETVNESQSLGLEKNDESIQDSLKTDNTNIDNAGDDTVITNESGNQDEISRATDMLNQDKSVGEIADSTSLTRKEIRQLRRKLRKEE